MEPIIQGSEIVKLDVAERAIYEDLIAEIGVEGLEELEFIMDGYFREYMEDLIYAEGIIPSDFPSWIIIDWERTIREIQLGDYQVTKINGYRYWYRII